MRRLLATTLVLFLGVLGGRAAARAELLRGTQGPDRLIGSSVADTLLGRGGNDLLVGLGGADRLDGGPGADRISAEEDGPRDRVSCGAGRDVVVAELDDAVADDCEVVSRQLSRDTTTDFDAQHQTQVEPASFAYGSTVVVAFQSGRLHGGGAAAIGFSTSTDAGATWRSGFLPSTPEVVSDPAVAFDGVHGVWLVAMLTEDDLEGGSIGISRSRDGIHWSAPVDAAGGGDGEDDKEWLACDNWPSSPFRGRCYLSYADIRSRTISTRRSTDGGASWSRPVAVPAAVPTSVANGAQPVVRPDGTLVVAYAVSAALGLDEIAAIRSTDGGLTFTPPQHLAALLDEDVTGMRAPAFPSAGVDASGTVYLVWSDARFRDETSANDIVLARSRDGVTWSAPQLVPTEPHDSTVDAFVPGLGVDPTTSGRKTRLAITYHSLPQAGGCGYLLLTCTGGVDVAVVTSRDAGATWSPPQRLSARPMSLLWLADGDIGRMTGDYIATPYVRGRPIPVFSLGSPPAGGELRQAIFATTRLP